MTGGDLLRVDSASPLTDAVRGRWLAWSAAAAVFLAVLAFAAAGAASAAARRAALEPRLATVVLPVQGGRSPADADVERVVAGLGATAGVAFARAVPPAELGLPPASLAAAVESAAGPALPRFVDLAVNAGAPLDLAALGARAAELVPGARVVAADPGPGAASWDPSAVRRAAAVGGAAALLALAAAAAAATRITLALQRGTIDLLRQLGAPDAYLAGQLERHALTEGLRGGALGFLAAGLALAAAAGLVRSAPPILSSLGAFDWLLLGAVPPAAALAGAAAARLVARSGLRRAG